MAGEKWFIPRLALSASDKLTNSIKGIAQWAELVGYSFSLPILILVIGVPGVRRIAALTICVGMAAAISASYVVCKNTVSRALLEQVQHGPGTIVDFTEVAPFAWERLYVFGPYTSHQRIHDSLGFHWPGVSGTTI